MMWYVHINGFHFSGYCSSTPECLNVIYMHVGIYVCVFMSVLTVAVIVITKSIHSIHFQCGFEFWIWTSIGKNHWQKHSKWKMTMQNMAGSVEKALTNCIWATQKFSPYEPIFWRGLNSKTTQYAQVNAIIIAKAIHSP